jgi:hypothetical protein
LRERGKKSFRLDTAPIKRGSLLSRGLGMSFRDNVTDAVRIATWRAPLATTTGMTPLTAFGLFAGAVLVVAFSQFLLAGASLQTFSAYGINSVIAIAAVQALVVIAFARIDPSSRTIRNLVLLHLVAVAIAIVENAMLQAFGFDDSKADPSVGAAFGAWSIIAASIIWTARGARAAFRFAPGVRLPPCAALRSRSSA